MSPLAELKTSDGTFIIQERRAVPRDPASARIAAPQSQSASPAMAALGGLTIIGVLVASYTTKYDLTIGHANGPIAIPAVGFIALQFFLVRAAYRLFSDVRQSSGLLDYAELRLLRYLPAVVPAVLLGFAISRFSGMGCFQASASSLPANLLMLSDMVGVADIDSSHWRLKIEIFLSLLIGLTWFTSMRRHLASVLMIGLIVSAMNVSGEPVRHDTLSLQGVLTADGYLPFFTFGIALYHVAHERQSAIWWGIMVASTILVFESNTPWHGVTVVASLAVLAAVVNGRLRFLGEIRCLVSLGDLAFPIYVVHYVAGFSLIHRMEMDGFPPIVAILAASVMAIAVGKFFNFVFEKPALAHGPGIVTACGHRVGAVLMPASRAMRSWTSSTGSVLVETL